MVSLLFSAYSGIRLDDTIQTRFGVKIVLDTAGDISCSRRQGKQLNDMKRRGFEAGGARSNLRERRSANPRLAWGAPGLTTVKSAARALALTVTTRLAPVCKSGTPRLYHVWRYQFWLYQSGCASVSKGAFDTVYCIASVSGTT